MIRMLGKRLPKRDNELSVQKVSIMYRTKEPTPEQLALRDQIRAEFPYLIDRTTLDKKISNMALGSKNIKRLLTHQFPGVKFSAKSDGYAGGSTIRVSWEDTDDGPTNQQVDALIDANFSYARFDGMTENTDYDRDPWREEFRALFGSASYVSSQSHKVSPEEIAKRRADKLQKATPTSPQRRRPGL
jgi:hypothetical protein